MIRRVACGAVLVASATACAGSPIMAVDGIVVAVDGDLITVRSFELRSTEGDRLTFEIDPLGDYAFPLPHLSSHMRSLDPVAVTFRMLSDGTLIATGIEDA